MANELFNVQDVEKQIAELEKVKANLKLQGLNKPGDKPLKAIEQVATLAHSTFCQSQHEDASADKDFCSWDMVSWSETRAGTISSKSHYLKLAGRLLLVASFDTLKDVFGVLNSKEGA